MSVVSVNACMVHVHKQVPSFSIFEALLRRTSQRFQSFLTLCNGVDRTHPGSTKPTTKPIPGTPCPNKCDVGPVFVMGVQTWLTHSVSMSMICSQDMDPNSSSTILEYTDHDGLGVRQMEVSWVSWFIYVGAKVLGLTSSKNTACQT